jgi:hypothetical protein
VTTPFDHAISSIATAGFHNHRLEDHSDVVSDGIVADLTTQCAAFRSDVESGAVRIWRNVPSPGDRRRNIDLFVGEPDAHGEPDITRVRLAIENKSVVTAHRNATSRFDDLQKVLSAVQSQRPEAILVATVLIGTARRVLNIPDAVKRFLKHEPGVFERTILPRLSRGDRALFDEFGWAVSENGANDASKSVALFRSLPTRGPAQTHLKAFDSVLLVPVLIDNVDPPSLPRPNTLGIDVDGEYNSFLARTCSAYTARYHL